MSSDCSWVTMLVAARGWSEGQAAMASLSQPGDPAGPHPGGSGQGAAPRTRGDHGAVKHPSQQEESPLSLLSPAREDMALDAACHPCTPWVGAAPTATPRCQGTGKRDGESPVGNLPGDRDVSPAQHRGTFLLWWQRLVRSCSTHGRMVGSSGSLLLKMRWALLQPPISQLVSHHRLRRVPSRSVTQEHCAVPHGSTIAGLRAEQPI